MVPLLVAGDLSLLRVSVKCLKEWRAETNLGGGRLGPAMKHPVGFLIKSCDSALSVSGGTD